MTSTPNSPATTTASPSPDEPDDLDTELHKHLTQTRAKTLALSDDPDAQAVHTLAATYPIGVLDARVGYARTVERRATDVAGIDPAQANAEITRARHTAIRIAIWQQVKPVDRHNIGIVTGLDDTAGKVDVEFTSNSGRQAARTFTWAQLDIVTPRDPEPRALIPAAQTALDHQIEPKTGQLDTWTTYLATRNVTPGDATRYERAAGLISTAPHSTHRDPAPVAHRPHRHPTRQGHPRQRLGRHRPSARRAPRSARDR